jgi:hypothetical protein
MTTDCTAYTQGLRALADLIDAHPDLPLPYERGVKFFIHGDLTPALKIRDLMVNPVTSRDTSVTFPVNINGRLAGLGVHVHVSAAAAGVLPDAPRPPCDPRLGLDNLSEQVA